MNDKSFIDASGKGQLDSAQAMFQSALIAAPGALARSLQQRYQRLRDYSESLVVSLSPEDMVVQSMPDASPAKWHLAHTTWFFESFLLKPYLSGYGEFESDYAYLFNSYYETLGPRHPRPQRGLLSRPPLSDVIAYRHYVDAAMRDLFDTELSEDMVSLLRLGFAHEEQHQELLLMDILHLFSKSPLKPAFDAKWPVDDGGRVGKFVPQHGGLVETGAPGGAFAFDNEKPSHRSWLKPYEIADRLVTNGEWLAFMADGGYRRAELWLSDGWDVVRSEGWEAPQYWEKTAQGWQRMSLRGVEEIPADAPVTHISYYEAAAYANWAGARLPSEGEWEVAATNCVLEQVDDVAWQWTQSAYTAYPGFTATRDAVGEYNGKFMIGQMVLRGGSGFTPHGHSRLTYRNFFRPEQRWMLSGLRLARDVAPIETTRSNDHTEFHVIPREPESQVNQEFKQDVIVGLSQDNKTLMPKYFYDDIGSELFEAICLVEEYYPTRTETALLKRVAAEIALGLPGNVVLVEFGSGASDKTRLLLDAAPQINAYVPIDISGDAIERAVLRLRQHYPWLRIAPLVDDFMRPLKLPSQLDAQPMLGFFPGSTIGNFTPPQAIEFLLSARRLLGKNGTLVIGADMVKDEKTLVAAYDDAAGVTARFNKNILARINRELGGNFDLDAFDHLARWNQKDQRMEMHLVSRREQTVDVGGKSFQFHEGERLHTENSHKFTPVSFSALAAEAGWEVSRQWISPAPEFGIFELKPIPAAFTSQLS